jgi:CHAT domain-containing protein
MKSFYLELQSSVSPSKALQLAQVRLIQKHPHPFFWAAFVLAGKW